MGSLKNIMLPWVDDVKMANHTNKLLQENCMKRHELHLMQFVILFVIIIMTIKHEMMEIYQGKYQECT